MQLSVLSTEIEIDKRISNERADRSGEEIGEKRYEVKTLWHTEEERKKSDYSCFNMKVETRLIRS